MGRRLHLPRLYAIADARTAAQRGVPIVDLARQMVAGGVTLLQYRDKISGAEQILENALHIGAALKGSGCLLLLNDHPELALRAGWDGVHLGQGDLSPAGASSILGSGKVIGVSTHTKEQVHTAELACADYLAIGPVFATGTKQNSEPVVGLGGVLWARARTTKPLVAIGGITLENASSVLAAGADSVAVISGFFQGSSVAAMTAGLLSAVSGE